MSTRDQSKPDYAQESHQEDNLSPNDFHNRLFGTVEIRLVRIYDNAEKVRRTLIG